MKTWLKATLPLTAALALMILPLAPAFAQVDAIQRIDFKSLQAGDVVVGTRSVDVEVEAISANMIRSIAITIKNNSGGNEKIYDAHTYNNGAAGTSSAAKIELVSEAWDTNVLTPRNGVYDVVADVVASKVAGVNAANEAKIVTLEDIKVNNPPAQPSGVSVSAPKQGEPKLTVSWNKNPELDVTGYKVSRSIAGGAYSEVFSGTGTSFADSGLPFDETIKYQVVTFRYSPVNAGNKIASPASTSSTVSIPKPPPPPPPPTPAEAKAAAAAAAKSAGPLDRLGSASTPSNPLRPVGIDVPPEPKGITGGFGFSGRLPFDQSVPQTFSEEETFSEKAGDVISAPGKLIGEQLRINPVRFLAAGTLLLVAAGHLARAARRLLISAPTASATPTPA